MGLFDHLRSGLGGTDPSYESSRGGNDDGYGGAFAAADARAAWLEIMGARREQEAQEKAEKGEPDG